MAIFSVLWLWTMAQFVFGGPGPNGKDFGLDYSHTQAAIVAIEHRLDPYNYQVLYHVQRQLLLPRNLPVESNPRLVLEGTSPFYLWILEPLAGLPIQVAAIIWMLVCTLLAAAGFWWALTALGWRHRTVACLLFLLTPAPVLALYWGNTVELAFAGVALSVPLLRRYPLAAGVLLSLSVLKLPAACPIAGIIVLFHASHRRRVMLGFLGAVVGRNLLAVAVLGPAAFREWVQGLFAFSQSIGLQPNLIGLSGLYAASVGHSERVVLQLGTVAVALLLSAYWYWRRRSQTLLATGWLWGVWLLATPYAHFVDEMFLAIPLAALVGRDGARLDHPLSIAALTLWLGSVFLFSAHVGSRELLWLPLSGLIVCLALGARLFQEAHPAAADL